MLQKVGSEWWDSEKIPDEALLRDLSRLNRAVEEALRPFVEGGAISVGEDTEVPQPSTG